jgi:hypothetical protein
MTSPKPCSLRACPKCGYSDGSTTWRGPKYVLISRTMCGPRMEELEYTCSRARRAPMRCKGELTPKPSLIKDIGYVFVQMLETTPSLEPLVTGGRVERLLAIDVDCGQPQVWRIAAATLRGHIIASGLTQCVELGLAPDARQVRLSDRHISVMVNHQVTYSPYVAHRVTITVGLR